MSRITCLALVSSLLIIVSLACSTGGAAPTQAPNTQATVDAAVAATGTAQVNLQATVDAGVRGTATAMAAAQAVTATATRVVPAQPTATGAPPSTVVVNPTPTPADYANMTEEELAALIDQAVAEAVAATQQASSATASATADATLSEGEAETMEVYINGAEALIAYTEELMSVYYGLYGELAEETVALLQEVEQDLGVMTTSLEAITSVLEQNSATLEQGLALAEDTVNALQEAAQTAQDRAAQAKDRSNKWNTQAKDGINRRAAAVQGVKPNQIASDRQGALLMAFDYLDVTRRALDDHKLSKPELMNIAQLGANAGASLLQHGGSAFSQMPDRISSTTTHVARGELPQAKKGLGDMDRDLGARPERPQPGGGDRPGGDRPGGDRPGKK
jgi:hypothetical protein